MASRSRVARDDRRDFLARNTMVPSVAEDHRSPSGQVRPSFGSPAVKPHRLIRGVASSPHGEFAFVGKVSPRCLVLMRESRLSSHGLNLSLIRRELGEL